MNIIDKKTLRRLPKGWHKYGAKSSKCFYGHYHPSMHEANVCNILLAKVNNKEIKGYQSQPKYPLYVNKKLICTHYPDFLVINNDGSEEVWEAKGIVRPDWRIKKNLFEALFPDIPYKVITRGSKYENFSYRVR